jgi:hypothetical protein
VRLRCSFRVSPDFLAFPNRLLYELDQLYDSSNVLTTSLSFNRHTAREERGGGKD